MEDSFKQMDELLHAWNLPQLCETFREQEINVNTLEALTDADIVELIPKVGPRALFRKRLTEWLNAAEFLLTDEEEVQKSSVENDNIQYFELETIDDSESSTEEIYLPKEPAIGNEVEMENKFWAENVAEESIPEEAATNETEEYLGIDFLDEVIEELEPKHSKLLNFKNRHALLQSKHLQTVNKKIKNKSAAKSNENIKEETIDIIKIETVKEMPANKTFNAASETLRYLNVEEILLSTEEGRTILESYEQNPHVDKKTRLYIADFIISEVFAKNLFLDRAKFQDIAQQIVELFPSENIKTWFIAQKGNSRNSSGTLYNKYYTVYRKMRKTGFYEHYVDGIIKQSDNESMEGDNNLSIDPEQIDDEPDKLAFKRAIPKYERLRRCCDFERIHVKTLLESSFEGRGIMEIYNKYKTFDIQARNRLCKLIVMEASHRNIKMRPRDFYDASCQIVDLFPNETIDMYFLPRGRTPPKGCLYHKYLYIKRRLRRIGISNKKQVKL